MTKKLKTLKDIENKQIDWIKHFFNLEEEECL
jgi:hypothetical protein